MLYYRTAQHASLIASFVAMTSLYAPTFAAEPADRHPDHTSAPVTLSLNAGKKWETDAPLRKAMANIREAMAVSLQPIHEEKFSAAQSAALAQKINDEVAHIVSNCKLTPKADAQLHAIIAVLLAGAEAIDGKMKGATRVDGAVKVLGALENYAQYFNDPSWKSLQH